MHKIIPEGSRIRGKKTIAKEKLYKHILENIKQIIPNFNIGISTGGDGESRWLDVYRHWKFIPKNHKVDDTKFK